jgi:hypothetical protein
VLLTLADTYEAYSHMQNECKDGYSIGGSVHHNLKHSYCTSLFDHTVIIVAVAFA